jgi:phage baseplate assembly protein gpV
MSPGQQFGLVIGIVRSVDDPESLGRVKVSFPWLSGDNESQWARVARAMAGHERGEWFMPEVDDEVLVGFEFGNMQYPIVVGFLWNGVDKPPNSGIDTKVRRLKTVSGHMLEFDDRSGQETIRVTTQLGHKLEMNDNAPVGIKITTNGGQEISLKDGPPAGIDIKTAMGNQLTISDGPAGITLSTPTGTLTITCLQANLTASATLNITAPITIFSGVVQIPTLIAQAVVSSAYTPAPGNTFGL